MSSNTNPNITLLREHTYTVDQIKDALSSATSILIATHEHPDGDALGSSLALYHALKQWNISATVYIPDHIPDFFSFLPGVDKLTVKMPDTTSFDAFVILDSTQFDRTHLEQKALEHPNTISIDHHHSNQRQAHINLVIPQAAATTNILFELFLLLDIEITRDIATCLLTGIFTDTGSFMHDSVTPEILEIASFLMNKGARLSHIAHETYQKKDLPALRIWGRALSRIITSPETGASISVITHKDLEECGATYDDLSGVVNMINTLPGSKFALLLTEREPGKIKGSLRSEPHKHVDVSKIARRLGGGGHVLASGFDVPGHIVDQNDMWRIVP